MWLSPELNFPPHNLFNFNSILAEFPLHISKSHQCSVILTVNYSKSNFQKLLFFFTPPPPSPNPSSIYKTNHWTAFSDSAVATGLDAQHAFEQSSCSDSSSLNLVQSGVMVHLYTTSVRSHCLYFVCIRTKPQLQLSGSHQLVMFLTKEE